jgi:serine/threonine-protein kinase RsbW
LFVYYKYNNIVILFVILSLTQKLLMTELAINMILESNPSNIAEVEPFVLQIVQEYNINQDVFGNILISLTEAVSNAIIHGNDAVSSKKVYVSSTFCGNSICFQVKDEGCGFQFDELPDPTAPENILTPGGRGVFLMRQLADSCSFLEDGRIVELEFSI